jgi:hypothetical protein
MPVSPHAIQPNLGIIHGFEVDTGAPNLLIRAARENERRPAAHAVGKSSSKRRACVFVAGQSQKMVVQENEHAFPLEMELRVWLRGICSARCKSLAA